MISTLAELSATPGPLLPDKAVWVVPLLLGVHLLLILAAAVIGPIYRSNVVDDEINSHRH